MPDSADTSSHAHDTEFDPLEFWIRYKSKILLYGGILIVGLAIFSIVELVQNQAKKAAEAAFASAKTADDFRKVADAYPHTIVGANAQLMLAEQLRNAGKNDDAAAALRTFISNHADHPLIAGAYLSLGSILENQDKLDEALTNYQKVTTSYLNSYAAPMAWLGQARILKKKGKTEEARRAYETVMNKFPDSAFAQQASQQVQKLAK